MKILLVVALVLVISISGSLVLADEITQCQTIDQSGYYYLSEDMNIYSVNDICLDVSGSDITIDGNGHNLNFLGSNPHSIGIDVFSGNNVIVKNFKLDGWNYAITVTRAEADIEGNFFIDNQDDLTISYSTYSFSNNTFSSNIFITSSPKGLIQSNNIYALQLTDSDYTTIKSNTFRDGAIAYTNSNYGETKDNYFYDFSFYLSSSNVKIYNNYFKNMHFSLGQNTNYWSTPKRLGTNIIGGKYLGGNYYDTFHSIDYNTDGISERSKSFNRNNVDAYPLAYIQKGALR